MISAIEIRHPYANEVPASLVEGLEAYTIDPEWQWVLVTDGKVKAQMLCANMHGLLMIMRLTSLPDAPQGWVLALCRRVFADCRAMGLVGYTTFLSDSTKAERRLMRIAQRSGGYLIPVTGVWAAGSWGGGY